MTSVWWIAKGSSRTITPAQWAEAGIPDALATVWDGSNGWSVDEATLTSDQLAILDRDSDFELGQTGPRAWPTPATGGGYQDYITSSYAYYRAILDMWSELQIDGSVSLSTFSTAVATINASIALSYIKPGTGIPKTDLAVAVQTSLDKADSAYQAPTFIGAGSTAANARSAIGAGTSNLAIGTTGSTAKAGDYQPTAEDISNSTSTGRSVLKSADALTARDTISAATRRRARTALTEGTIKGGNITVKPAGASWAGLWSEWDWTNWLKPQVDRAIALGLNAVRLIGAPQVVLQSGTGSGAAQISQATYDAQWKQLAQYCLEQGLRLYPCLTEKWAFYNGSTYSFQGSAATTCITTTAAALATYQNVIGFDLFQEGSGSSDGLVLADVLALYGAVRVAAPGVPLTTSNSSGNFGSASGFWTDATSLPYTAWMADGGADFVDLHIYLEGANAVDIDGFIERTKKPILIGEFGADQGLAADANRIARYTSARVQHPRVLGSLVWALADQGTTNANKAGVWDNTGFSQGVSPLSTTSGQRAVLVTELRKFPAAPTPAAAYRSPNLLSAAQTNPTATTAGWATGANTYLSATSEGLAVAATAAGNVAAGTTPSNGTPVLASTPYVAAVKVLAATSYSSKPVSLQIDWYDASNVYITSSPLTNAIDSTTSPLSISVVRISPSNAAFAVVTFKGYGFVANENHLLINCSLRQYSAGELESSAYPVAALASGEGQLFSAPSGALWTSLDRSQVAISASLGFAVSGTSRAILGGFPKPTLVTGLKFLTGTTAAVTPTHWWVVATDTSGTVLAVSADQTTTAIPASTVIAVPFTSPTVLAGNVYFHLMIVAATMPTLAGITGLLNSPTVAPVFSGASTAGQTTPPSVGGTLAAPSSQSATNYWYWAY